MTDLREQVAGFLRAQSLFRPGQRILVAVSGGLDSMVLLELLHAMASRNRWKLSVAHLNHRLRGRSSDADERLVIQTARRLRLPVVTERQDVRTVARARKLSIEMAARQVRHDFLASAAARLHVPSIALAHHADDQLELFFLRLLRGSGGAGLGGMKVRNPSPSDPQIELVRPLLAQPKSALRDYARANRVRYREDASNASLDIQRNRIRHELLPLLRRKYQPALDRTVLRGMEITGAEAECARQIAEHWLALKRRTPFRKLPVAIQRACVQVQLSKLGISAEFECVERLRLFPGSDVTVAPRVNLLLTSDGGLRRQRPTERKKLRPSRSSKRLKLELRGSRGTARFGGLQFAWRLISKNSDVPRKRMWGREVFDASRVGSRLLLRHWQPGDRFQPIGMASGVKLQNLFTNLKIPREERHKLVLLVRPDGELVWVQNLRISERFKLTRATNRRLQWQWKRL